MILMRLLHHSERAVSPQILGRVRTIRHDPQQVAQRTLPVYNSVKGRAVS